MAKKDFSAINTDRVYNTIAQATAEEPETPDTQEAQETQGNRRKYKARKEYTEQEAAEYLMDGSTSGRKGVKMPRINMAFYPDVYEYIQTMSRVRGESLTAFINLAIRQHMRDHGELYKKAIEFRNSLDNL